MTEPDDGAQARPYSRRRFLGQVGAVGAAGVLGPLFGAAASGASTSKRVGPTLLGGAKRTSPVKQIIVLCQENHSFDNYFGSYSKLPTGYGIPAGWQNSGIKPWHFTNNSGNGANPNHDWTSTH